MSRPPGIGGRAPGRVLLVGCGPGPADLLTVRGVRALEAAEVVLHDSLVSEEVLALAPRHARRIRVGRRVGEGGTDPDWVGRLMVREARAGATVARLHGGDPAVFGRLGEELAFLREAGVPFEVIPGVTAACAAAALLGVPLTRRGVASALVLVAGWNDEAVRHAAEHPSGTVAFYMAGKRVGHIAGTLLAGGRPPGTPVALVLDAGGPRQDVRRSTLAGMAALPDPVEELDGRPALLLVGEVLAEAAASEDNGGESWKTCWTFPGCSAP